MLFKIAASRFGIGRFPKLSKNATNIVEMFLFCYLLTSDKRHLKLLFSEKSFMYRHSTSEATTFSTKNNDLTNFCVQSNIQSSEAFFSLIYIKNFPISATKQLFRWISPISVMNEKCRHDGKSLKVFV